MKNHIIIKLLLLTLFFVFGRATAQIDTSKTYLSFSGYLEVYYAFDFNKPEDHNRPEFIYSHNRHNEFNLNLGFLKTSYSTERVRANVALAVGTYMNANYSAEAGVLKNIYEANAGVKLCKSKSVWFDAGIFASHIGFESAMSKDCWGLTRSLLADNSPYYESGAKLTFTTDNSKWLVSALILNGWQHIQRPDGNNTPAFGSQFIYNRNSKIILNYSNFLGNEKPDTAIQIRHFHNFYGMFHFSDKLHATVGFDFGMEQKSEGSSDYNKWFSPVLVVKYNFNDKWSVTGRGEYYADENGVIIDTGTPNGFQTIGYSLNVDCEIRNNVIWRIEGRNLNSKDKIFTMNHQPSNRNFFITSSLAVSF